MSVPNESAVNAVGSNCFKEAVCIDTKRIYDSCSDKDCLDDLQVYFTDCDQKIIDCATSVRVKGCEILNVYLDVESIPFNKGFYSVDITFFFEVKLSAYTTPLTPPVNVKGVSIFSKKVILYGSEGSVRVFTSECGRQEERCQDNGLPKASVQCVDPVCLAVRLVEKCDCYPEPICEIPNAVSNNFEGLFAGVRPEKAVYITLGLFTIVQLERYVQIMIPAYDFCVPGKESVTQGIDDPCELFKKIKFPTDAFFPPKLEDLTDN